MMAEPYSQLIQARCQPGFAALVDRAAQGRGMSHSVYVRQALQTALQLDGFDPAAIPEREDEQALVAGSRVLTIALGRLRFPMPDYFPAGYVATGDERWLPVEEEAPGYDPKLHWKAVPPTLRIEADRVVRVFGIIPKSFEAI